MTRLHALSSVVLGLGLLSACGKDDPADSAARFEIAVRPLSLGNVTGASYALTVRNADTPPNDLVWTKSGITSNAYGDGEGAIAYVGPCDATQNPHRVEVVLESLLGPNGTPLGPNDYSNPAPADRPIVLTADCRANADTLVSLDLTVLRSADQGFFDVGVTFMDIFCSAKLDCSDALLTDPNLEGRGPTAIVAFACTSGQADDATAEPTWLHFTDVTLTCDGEPTLYFEPSLAAGQHGPLGGAPTFFESAIYRGQESLPGLDKCYWNMAFGLRAGADNCRLRAQATASHVPFGAAGTTPANTIWAYVDWDVQLTDGTGAIVCGDNPLNGPTSGVVTRYTPPAGAAFAHEWQCGSTTIDTRRLACVGESGDGSTAYFNPTPDGLSVSLGGLRSPTYVLPTGRFAGSEAACCMNPCCDATQQ